jgi:Na+-transporting methylmalonyl-CoA/oxaloacetate decarboxylase gamma subunit
MIFNLILTKLLAVIQYAQSDSLLQHIHENAEEFEEVDPVGFGLAAVGIAVVFSSLLLLYVVFLNLTKLIQSQSKKKRLKEGHSESSVKESELTGEINAAISAALYFYSQELHDQESAVLTINRVSRTYSPWSSKIYGLRQNPR